LSFLSHNNLRYTNFYFLFICNSKITVEYLNNHPELGYRSIAEFLNKILRNKAKEILDNEEKLEN